MRQGALLKVWDERGKLVDLIIYCPTPACNQPTEYEKELVRIFSEHKQLQDLEAENEKLKKHFDWLSGLVILNDPEVWEHYLEDMKKI